MFEIQWSGIDFPWLVNTAMDWMCVCVCVCVCGLVASDGHSPVVLLCMFGRLCDVHTEQLMQDGEPVSFG